MTGVLIWTIAAGAIGGVLLRPKDWPEAVWACLGAVLLVVCGLLPAAQAAGAVAKGNDVYLFLTGMMLLSELARREGVFDWLASHAVAAAKGSPSRLFTLVYLVGTMVTIFLSNDATAVVLTPAVYAAVRAARVKGLPFLLICAFIANAASFVLPISNPANLVVYGKQLPPLVPWFRTFLLPSVVSVIATYAALRLFVRKDLSGPVESEEGAQRLTSGGKLASYAILGTGLVLIVTSTLGKDLGLPTFLAAAVAVLLATRARVAEVADLAKGVAWSVLPLVAGLFVLVEAMDQAGARDLLVHGFERCAQLPRITGSFAAAFGIAALSNLMNNLPSGLLAGSALQSFSAPPHIRDAV
ncbi:MAG: anion permease, partial [Acidobacteriaceae bacterium]|nr:anion permease [Acidobacteriaceae bacterium]